MSSTRVLAVALATTFTFGTMIARPAAAVSLSVANAGFEDPPLADGDFTFIGDPDPAPGWTLFDPFGEANDFGVFNPPVEAFPGEAPVGENVGYVFSTAPGVDPLATIGLAQVLGDALTAGIEYTLEVEVGDPLAYDIFALSGFPGYRIELLAGGVVLAADDNTLALVEGTFATSTVSFVAPLLHPNLGDLLEIRLLSLLGDGQEVGFDDVRLTAVPAAVPAPSTVVLVLLATIGLAVRRRRAAATV